MSDLEKLKTDVEKIKARNAKVERDKAWETSWTRRLAIATSTYILISIFLAVINTPKPLISAIIPAAAYLISTSTLEYLKSIWLRNRN